ncbi:MAG: flagellar motor switch protein FliM [Candidatus Margulisbacteria bacterium GWF2_35_9]|nr:MAG: flagellar motor switch protein FliM [Candidatus Margulisbacteria bacterium GWF2_35_9]
MSNILSQEEINALLMGVLDEADDVANDDSTHHSSKPTYVEEFQHVTKYDFRRPNKFSKDLLRILKGFHDNMARLFSASLSVYLRQDVKIHLTYIEQHTYSEYIEDSNESSLYYIISFIDDQAILSLDVNIALLLVEKILGGEGYSVNTDRTEPTEIEMVILRNILDKLFHHQKESWGDIMKDLPRIITVENNPRVIHLVQPNDIVLKMVFEVSIGDGVGIFTYCIPYIALEHVMNQLLQSQFVRMQHQFVKKTEEMQNNLSMAKIDLSAELGRTTVTVEDLIEIKIGDVIKLDTKKNQDLVMKLGGFKKFSGELGVSDKSYAIKINQIHFNL